MTNLFDAIRQGDGVAVQSLLASNPELAGARNAEGATPALWAAYTRHPELTDTVLAGREPDFFEACALGNRERVSALLALDGQLADQYSADGFTPLGLAIFFGHEEVASQLADSGADVNRPSRNAARVAPLHSAVASGSMAMVKLLLDRGAHPDSAEFHEATPLHSAAGHGNREMGGKYLACGGCGPRAQNKGRQNGGGSGAAVWPRGIGGLAG